MKRLIGILLVLICTCECYPQTFTTRNGYIGFFSKTPLEDIKAENRQVYAVIDASKKNLAFTCLVKGFLFAKELMQEHFNENYIESDKYPKASFIGAYTGDVNVSKDGTYPVQVKGQLTLHGVTQTIDVPATLEVKGGKVTGASNFKLTPADFNIKIPSLVRQKIAKQIDVHVLIECNPK
jgi:YceI-like domain